MIRLSLIIPTHNRSERLIAALESVIRQDLPAADWECVVVSNNSTDDTVARFGDFAARYPGLNLRLVTEDGPGVSYARNRGIAETSAPLLVFIDDDNRYMYDLRHEVRFVNATEYNVTSPETFMGFLCGILAGNYDMKQLFIDGFLRLVKSDIADLEAFFARLDEITHRHGVDVVISVSAKDEETPEYLKKYIQD